MFLATPLARYASWLHTAWPAGKVERLPEVREDGTTRVPGVRVVGDLTGVPLLKLAVDSGARSILALCAEPSFTSARGQDEQTLDVAIIGGGVAGIAAALEAQAQGLRFCVYEATMPFGTVHGFPRGKPIFTYPTELEAAGHLALTATVKEALVDELESQRRAAGIEPVLASVDRVEHVGGALRVCFGERRGEALRAPVRALRVIIAIGRSGNYRKIGCPGETLDKVMHRLLDPTEYDGKDVLVVGGGDSALESAVALHGAGARVTLSHRGTSFQRAKPENVAAVEAQPGIQRRFQSSVLEIGADEVRLKTPEGEQRLPNQLVFAMIGREAPLDFFRRSGIPIRGEWTARTYASFAAFVATCWFVYLWKAGSELNAYFSAHRLFPFNLPERIGDSALGHALGVSLRQPGFYYSLLYSLVIVVFGLRRIRRRNTPYVTLQTRSLMLVQVVPLFLLPYLVLPTLGYLGAFDTGLGRSLADALFPSCGYDYGREYWRAFGLVLAWPLFFWNAMNGQPLTAWLIISGIQTFVVIPLIVWRWGKGAYCGWICSCGALAETLGDDQRHKMPHGRVWNRLNLVGQAILLWASLLLVARTATWVTPGSALGRLGARFVDATFYAHAWYDYYHLVDIFLAGILGVGVYFWFSGRAWCRFACPLAALMHVYARLGNFRIFAEKKKCISCGVCTAVCHQGIDVMSFANRGEPMADPECVRCSACVQSCPTGVLSFGRVAANGPVLDRILASPVQRREGRHHLRVIQ